MEWTAMEINPEMLNKMMNKLGVGESWRFVDVLGLEGDQLSAVPKPCCALMLLFPLTQQVIMGVVVVEGWGDTGYSNSALKKFLDDTAGMSADDRAKQLEKNQAIQEAHNEVAVQGQCRPEADKVNFHFIAFVNVNGQLYEFDGRMNGPVKHGATKDESFVTVGGYPGPAAVNCCLSGPPPFHPSSTGAHGCNCECRSGTWDQPQLAAAFPAPRPTFPYFPIRKAGPAAVNFCL
eukprot:superscaffoldBa00002410_g14153